MVEGREGLAKRMRLGEEGHGRYFPKHAFRLFSKGDEGQWGAVVPNQRRSDMLLVECRCRFRARGCIIVMTSPGRLESKPGRVWLYLNVAFGACIFKIGGKRIEKLLLNLILKLKYYLTRLDQC